jgi:hypothetical protein
LFPLSFRGGTDEVGQIASTICVDVSTERGVEHMSYDGGARMFLTNEVLDEAELPVGLAHE